jgi:hypothetical protein
MEQPMNPHKSPSPFAAVRSKPRHFLHEVGPANASCAERLVADFTDPEAFVSSPTSSPSPEELGAEVASFICSGAELAKQVTTYLNSEPGAK